MRVVYIVFYHIFTLLNKTTFAQSFPHRKKMSLPRNNFLREESVTGGASRRAEGGRGRGSHFSSPVSSGREKIRPEA